MTPPTHDNDASTGSEGSPLDRLERRFSPTGMARNRCRKTLKSIVWMVSTRIDNAAKRALDVIFAVILSVLLAPLWSFALLVYGIDESARLGKYGKLFNEISFRIPGSGFGRVLKVLKVHRYGALYNILRGDMSFIGPRAASPNEMSLRKSGNRNRLTVKPGLVCLWWVRKRVNIAFDPEPSVDAEYIETHTVSGDLGILARSLVTALYGRSNAPAEAERISILGIPIDNLTMDEAVNNIIRRTDFKKQSKVSFVNADCANISWRNQEYMRTLVESDLVLPDGIGMKLAGRMLKQDIRENVNGTDMFPRLCAAMESEGKSIFLLGGREGVATAVSEWIARTYPRLKICGTQHGYYDSAEECQVVRKIADSKPDVLIVAFGAPRQEVWIRDHLEEAGARVAIGVGGLLDFHSGRIPRAPLWMREIGLEWLYRFLQEPGRLWKRYLVGNSMFMIRFLCHRSKGRKYPSKGIESKCVQ